MKPRRGYVLLAALALCLAISAVALAAGAEVRMRRTAAVNSAELMIARKAAESALAEARITMTEALRDPLTIDPWRALHDAAYGVAVAGASATAKILDAESVRDTTLHNARINLNTAAESALLSVLPPGVVQLVLRERSDGRRITSLFQVVNQLPATEQATIAEVLPALEQRVTLETRYVRVTANTRRVEAKAEALFAREGSRARLMRLQWQ